jgi:hypothetical protein
MRLSAPNPLTSPRKNPLRSQGPAAVDRNPAVEAAHTGDQGTATRNTPRAAKR